jgi:hypothetical protein
MNLFKQMEILRKRECMNFSMIIIGVNLLIWSISVSADSISERFSVSQYELLDLFNAGVDIYSWGPFDNSGKFVWAFDLHSADLSFLFSFVPDYDAVWLRRYSQGTIGNRVFAVYSPPIRRRLVLRTSRSWNQFDFPLFPRYSG